MKVWIDSLVLSLLFLVSTSAYCTDLPSWSDYVAALRTEALAEGVRPQVFDEAFASIHAPSLSILHFDHSQPEKRLDFLTYRNTRVDPYRIHLGRQALREHQAALENISKRYGVSACFIVSIWGLETSYGRYRGKFPVIQALATLAYNPRRSTFFHNELRIALQMLNSGQVKLADFKGEWAGASGHCQFLPSTWAKFAVAYQGEGRGDIWNKVDDALASIANFLEKSGWRRDEPTALPVLIPPYFNQELVSIKTTKKVSEWLRLGVRPLADTLPEQDLQASIIYPEGGPGFMVFNNFKTLLAWNRSNYYVGALTYLAESICQKTA